MTTDIVALGVGDPHYSTFDSNWEWITFNGKGDFVLLEALKDKKSPPVFTLQGRLDVISVWPITTHQALAFGDSNSVAFHVCNFIIIIIILL